jgi:hypothetical protein
MMRTVGPSERILRLENGGASANGLDVMFDIVTKDGKSHAFWLARDNIEKFVSYIIGLSQHGASVGGGLKAPPDKQIVTASPIEGVALSLAPGRIPTEALLSVHLGTFALTFVLSANALHELQVRLQERLHPMTPQKPN